MLYQFAGDGTRPTYFEMAAAEQLTGSLKAALLYTLGVMAQRIPRLHSVLDFGDEAMAGLLLLLEWHNLRTHDASFGESLFGLKRERYIKPPAAVAGSSGMLTRGAAPPPAGAQSTAQGLRRRDRALSLFFLVGLPYLKSKLHAAYMQRRQHQLTSSLWSDDTENSTTSAGHSDVTTSSTWRTSHLSLIASLRQGGGLRHVLSSLSQMLQSVGSKVYPWIHAQYEGLQFMYHLLYMLDATPFYLPSLHLLRLHVRRSTPDEMSEAHSVVEARRKSEFQRIPGPPWVQRAASTALGTFYTALDYSQTGIIAAVFLFKMLEWWYQTGEQRMSAPAVFPPPPPPPPPKPAKGGLSLPSDKRLCPLCLKLRTNPTICEASGFAFCYPCIFAYVDEYKCCPVTLYKTDVSRLRRLFQNA